MAVATINEMVEAHLMNVEREINTLRERQVGLDQELQRLTAYLEDGRNTLQENQRTSQKAVSSQPANEGAAQIFNPTENPYK